MACAIAVNYELTSLSTLHHTYQMIIRASPWIRPLCVGWRQIATRRCHSPFQLTTPMPSSPNELTSVTSCVSDSEWGRELLTFHGTCIQFWPIGKETSLGNANILIITRWVRDGPEWQNLSKAFESKLLPQYLYSKARADATLKTSGCSTIHLTD